jgi:hypothetical protein
MAEKFHERFNIQMPMDEAKRRFVNRAHSQILSPDCPFMLESGYLKRTCMAIAFALGEKFDAGTPFRKTALETYTGLNFERTLQAIEATRRVICGPKDGPQLDEVVEVMLSISEVDLGIRWNDGKFLPSGAKLLDDTLVNESLKWLREKNYRAVLAPFEKGLEHLLRARAKPELLLDVVTDAYEALEALAKILTGKDRTLDANRELFLSKVNASDEYKKILHQYCEYAHNFRHGAIDPTKKRSIAYSEAESFVYLTGVFLRLAISATVAAEAPAGS